MRNLNLILLIAIFSALGCFAQDDPNNYVPKDYSILPPSPEVASLMKYIDVPVSYYTGQPEVNIPIYTLKEGELSIPVSISYHGGGIKVNEHDGIIGIGWTLMAGGSVSRTVYGFPDEIGNHSGTENEIRGLFRLHSADKALRNRIIDRYADYDPKLTLNHHRLTENGNACIDYNAGKFDVANDILHFNALGMSGTFIYDSDSHNITMSTGSPVTFTSDNYNLFTNYPLYYKFADNNSTVYTFEELEKTRYEYSYLSSGTYYSDSIQYSSAWHLTEVNNIYGDSVIFQYSEARFKMLSNGPYHSFEFSRDTDYPNKLTMTGSTLIYYPKVLTTIKSKSTIIEFHYDTNFEILQSITVHRNDTDKTMIKQFILNHSLVRMGSKDKKFLDNIQEVSMNKEIDLYKFEYVQGSTLSDKYTFAQDHWGYYSGIHNLSLLWQNGNEIKARMANDRSPNLASTKIGVLSSIVYPTGGKTTFEWELNDYSNITNYKVYPISTTDTIYKSYYLSGIARCQTLTSGTFHVPPNARNYLNVDISKYIKPLIDGGSGMYDWNEYRVNHSGSEDNSIPQIQIIKIESNGAETIAERFFIDKRTSDNNTNYTELAPGTYYIRLANPRNFEGVQENTINGYFGFGSESYCGEHGYAIITLKILNDGPLSFQKWGGLRIKNITSISGLDEICKNYEYKTDFYGHEYSTGVIQMEPRYEYKKEKSFIEGTEPSSNEVVDISFICTTSNGLYSTPIGGANIEYHEVWESYSGTNFKDIKMKYSFTTFKDYPDVENILFTSYIPGGCRMMTSNAHHRGIMTNKCFYNAEGLKYKDIAYNYEVREGTSPIFTGPFVKITDCSALGIFGNYSDYTVAKYSLIPYNKLLMSEVTTDFDSDGDEIYSDSIEYTYFRSEYSAKPDNSLIRSMSYKKSNGELVTTYYSYYKPDNLADPDTSIPYTGISYADMKETEVTVINGKIISAKKMEYNVFTHHLIKVYSIPTNTSVLSTYQLGSDYSASAALLNAINVPEYQYEYDGRGNLVQISYNGEILASYLWGYNGMYPILEAKGVGISNLLVGVRSMGINSGEQLSDITDDTQIRSILSQLRTKFPGKDLITMTYHWLIGVSTATDSRGVTTHFSFDDFGRLKDVKDYNGYFIRKYDYHYAGQK